MAPRVATSTIASVGTGADGEATLRIGLAGCGRIAQLVHLSILTRLPGTRLVAIAEADPRRRAEASRRAPGAAVTDDWAELTSMSDVDAIVVALPNHLHAAAGLAALTHGKHLYLEKPLATSLEDGRTLVLAAQEAGVVAMVGFNYRFNENVAQGRRALDSDRLGPLVAARTVFTTAARELPEWKRSGETGGGVLLDLASHHVDLVHFLLRQEVREVFARVSSVAEDGDTATLELRLATGLPVQTLVSLAAPDEDRVEIHGLDGRLTIDRHRNRHLSDRLFARSRERSFEAALASFGVAARAGLPSEPDLADGFRSLRVVLAAEESARTGRSVAVEASLP